LRLKQRRKDTERYIEEMAKDMAREPAPKGIRVNAVAPLGLKRKFQRIECIAAPLFQASPSALTDLKPAILGLRCAPAQAILKHRFAADAL
jgi:NAD(P)-dependent dehydrogenase (short-subunit alcohol dehydrogenase family)